MEQPEAGRLYRHYKGGYYRIRSIENGTVRYSFVFTGNGLIADTIHERAVSDWFTLMDTPQGRVQRYTLIIEK